MTTPRTPPMFSGPLVSGPPVFRPAGGEPAELRAWADAGLQDLTGPPTTEGLGPPAGLVGKVADLAARIACSTGSKGRRWGDVVELDGLALLAERAAIAGLRRRGTVSCGRGTHLVPTADGWVALSLVRPDDRALLPAWLGVQPDDDDSVTWGRVYAATADRTARELVRTGAFLGLPVAELPTGVARPARRSPVRRSFRPRRTGARVRDPGAVRVADLSSLWAGPLCGRILAAAGAPVVKVESVSRPDGARFGPADFFDRLNGDKRAVTLDLGRSTGVDELRELLGSVDVVIESARPRALAQLGISPVDLLDRPGGPTVWVSITGYGRDAAGGGRVAFGDDAAVAGGLVAWSGDVPYFCGDAIADPLSGLTAAAAVLDVLDGADRPVLLDVSMRDVAAHFAGPTCSTAPMLTSVR